MGNDLQEIKEIGRHLAMPEGATQTHTGLQPYSGAWGYAQAKHLLKRTMFGSTKADINHLLTLSFQDAVQLVLSPSTVPPTPIVNNYFAANPVPDPNVAPGQSFENAPYDNQQEYWRTVSVKNSWIHRMRFSPISIEQKLIYFWHNHLPVQLYPVFSGPKNIRYLDLLRTHAFGNFRAFVKALTLDPAMLTYLNGQYNSVWSPDENYARELQELFCIGKGANAQFTEGDVQMAAKILTGWRIMPDYSVFFDPIFHDSTNKQFSPFYNNTAITGRTGPLAGDTELEALLDMIFDVNEVADFICRKLYVFFLNHEITPQVEADIIAPLADIFRNSNYQIRPVLEAFFSSEHFFDTNYHSAVLKSPLDFIIGMSRECNMVMPDYYTQPAEYFDLTGAFIWYLSGLQQDPGDPPSVAGHPAWYQMPSFDKLWINTDSYPKRIKFADYMIYYGHGNTNYRYQLDVLALTTTFDNPSDVNLFIDEAVSRFLGLPISAAAKLQLQAILLSGQTSTYYWTNAWQTYMANPSDPTATQIVLLRLRNFYSHLFHFEEYQLM